MSETEPTTPKIVPDPASPAGDAFDAPLPSVLTELEPTEIVERLDARARRGKLAGFARGKDTVLFSVTDFGLPFESVLEGRTGVDRTGSGTIDFSVRVKPTMPTIFVIVLILTIWPGVYLMESFLGIFPGSSEWMWSGYWYLPLTILSTPLAIWSAWSKSRKTADAEARKIIATISTAVDGELIKPVS